MKRLLVVALLVALGAGQACAEAAPRGRKSKQEAKKPNPCAVHGPGFTMLPGTTTCVRIGGAAMGDFSAGRGSAPNLGLQ